MDYNVRGMKIKTMRKSHGHSIMSPIEMLPCLFCTYFLTMVTLYKCFTSLMQILPVSIKSLAGSVATLANWFSASVVTVTANLLLTWSSGGSLSLSLSVFVFV